MKVTDPRQLEVIGRAHTLRALSDWGDRIITLTPAERQYVEEAERHIIDEKTLPSKQCELIVLLYTLHYKPKMRAKLKEAEDARKKRELIEGHSERHGEDSI